jgi:Ca2+-binding RTX toxin-like protein
MALTAPAGPVYCAIVPSPGRPLLAVLLLAALIALSSVAGAAAHQKVTIEQGEGFLEHLGTNLVIHGDDRPDLVTVFYDPLLDEFLIGHDIEEPIPEGCYRDSKEPFHILHCPRGLITGRVFVYTGVGSDKVVITAKVKDVVDSVRAFLGVGNDSFEGDEEDDEVDEEEGNDQATTGGGADTVKGGPGSDKARGGPGPDRLFGGPSADWLFGGPGGDFLAGGPSADHCLGGPGKERVSGCEIGFRY